jgi:hypothetical protein
MVKVKSFLIFFEDKHPLNVAILIIFLLVSSGLTSADDLSPPTFLTAVGDQNGEVPLFWFSPHPETSQIAYHSEPMSDGFYVSSSWQENCVAVRMSWSEVPFYLLKSRIYVSHQGVATDTNYSFKVPFFVTVNQDSGGIPKNSFLDSVMAAAGGEDSLSGGEWVDIEHNVLMEDSVFWIVFHWMEDSPLSPLVGEDNLPNCGNSFWGKRRFFHFEWHQTYHNAMIQAQIATNSDNPAEVDSFRIYRSNDPDSLIYQSNIISVLPGLQFQYLDGEVTEEQTHFYRVTAFNSYGQSKASPLAQATPRRGAELIADEEAFLIYSTPDGQVFDYLTLTNSGGLPLNFRIQISMEDTDWMGGPDPFGYTWSDNYLQTDLGFTWIDIENRGIIIGASEDDNEDYGFFELNFSFPFYDSTFNNIRISSDGWLGFSDLIPCYTDTFMCWANKSLPWLWGPYYLLTPFWDDLKLIDSSAIYLYSSSDSAIISFINLHSYGQSGGGPYTFQTILTPDGDITFQYLHIHDSLYSATVGLQNQDGTIGLEVLHNQKSLRDSLKIKIRPSWIRVDSMKGQINPGEGKTLNMTFDPLNYPKGIYHADLLVDSWDKNHQLEAKAIPLIFCIDTATSVDWTDAGKPEKVVLLQNYPNPFNPTTTIHYTIHRPQSAVPSPIPTTLRVYNVLGQKVRTLVDELKSPGNYEVIWNGKDDKEKEVASGIYFCKLSAGSYQKTRKLILLK